MIYAEDLDFTVSREGSCTGTGFCRQSMQKKNTQYSCYGHTDHGKETGADLLLSAFEILIKYVKHKTLDEMLQEWKGVSQFIIVMDTWFERLMAE